MRLDYFIKYVRRYMIVKKVLGWQLEMNKLNQVVISMQLLLVNLFSMVMLVFNGVMFFISGMLVNFQYYNIKKIL